MCLREARLQDSAPPPQVSDHDDGDDGDDGDDDDHDDDDDAPPPRVSGGKLDRTASVG